MKCTYQWLKEFVDFDLTPSQLADRLTLLGLEVDSCETVKRKSADALVGRIIKKSGNNQYSVDLGKKKSIARGESSTFEPGQKIIVQDAGSSAKAKIATYRSLGISDEDTPVYVGDKLKIGDSLEKEVPAEDTVYDIDLTPNRPDCLSIIGIAREIATYTGKTLRVSDYSLQDRTKIRTADRIRVEIESPDDCPRYTARIVASVAIRPSVLLIYDRLVKTGIRPINNLVDVTNYVLMELGFPLHAFDYGLVEDQSIVVSLSRKGQKFETLDGKTHELPKGTILICDGKRPVALGGIMGGMNTEVSGTTTDVLLECAYFDPKPIGKNARQLGISTEASIRFSRGVDPNGLVNAINRAAHLMAEASDGEIYSGVVDNYPKPISPLTIPLRISRIGQILGVDVTQKKTASILSRLGCENKADSKNKDQIRVVVPTYRPDLDREIDLIEEISRIIGYDFIPERTKFAIELTSKNDLFEKRIREIRNFFVGHGFFESVSNSMIQGNDPSLDYYPGKYIRIQNPISEDMAVLRPSLLPSILKVAQYNLFRQIEDLKIFEIGNSYFSKEDSHSEMLTLSGLICGNLDGFHWRTTSSPVDFFDMKGTMEAFLTYFGITGAKYTEGEHWAMGENVIHLVLNGTQVGSFGQLKQDLQQKYDLAENCQIFELNLGDLIPSFVVQMQYRPVPRYPFIRRDLAFLLDLDTPGGEIVDKLKEWGGINLKEIGIFDVYAGKQVPIGKKSVAFTLRFQSEERTLTEQEVNECVDRMIAEASRKFDARLRDQS